MSKTKTIDKKKEGKLPFGTTPAWSSRSISVAVGIVLLGQVSFYATESVGLSAAIVGTILAISKAFDAVTDLVSGFIVDRTRSKLGKGRPYELFIVPFWLCIVAFFSTPVVQPVKQLQS